MGAKIEKSYKTINFWQTIFARNSNRNSKLNFHNILSITQKPLALPPQNVIAIAIIKTKTIENDKRVV